MGKELWGLILFGMLFVFGIFTIYPFTNDASITNNPFGEINKYQVTGNWSQYGELTNLNTDGDIIYPGKLDTGNFSSFVQQEETSRKIEFQIISEPLDGNITAYINSWENVPNGDKPDETFVVNVDEEDLTTMFNASQYNYFNVDIMLEETGNSNNERPAVNEFTLTWIDESEQLGLTSEDFRVFVLFVFIGSGLMALIEWI